MILYIVYSVYVVYIMSYIGNYIYMYMLYIVWLTYMYTHYADRYARLANDTGAEEDDWGYTPQSKMDDSERWGTYAMIWYVTYDM